MKWVCPSATQCLSSLNGANATVYVYDAHGKLAAEYGPQADVGTRYLMADHLGSTRVVVDSTGLPQQCNDYLPFGEDIPSGKGGRGSCFPNGNYPEAGPDKANQKFTGKERDWETGLDYFGARYFSGPEGRFTSPDWSATPQAVPFADLSAPQTLDLYAYVRNNPFGAADPDGHCCLDYAIGFGKGIANRVLDNVSGLAKNGDPVQKLINGAVKNEFSLYRK
jgi:RHS repeat-associated protein